MVMNSTREQLFHFTFICNWDSTHSSDIPYTTGTKTDESHNKTLDLRSDVKKKNVIIGTIFCINSTYQSSPKTAKKYEVILWYKHTKSKQNTPNQFVLKIIE